MKKGKNLVLIIVVLLIILPLNVFAEDTSKTLGDYKKELTNLKNQKKENQNTKKLTQNQIDQTKNDIGAKHNEILKNQDIIMAATEESKALEKEIDAGKDELAGLISYYQVMSSDNAYLNYIFGSSSYEELVFRYAIVDQITSYQDSRITEWEDKIAYNNQLKADLQAKEEELNKQIEDLNKDVSKLGNNLDELNEMALDIDAEIKSIEGTISYYDSIGCKDTETLAHCLKVYGDTKFRRPLTSGRITSAFGYRTHPITGKVNSFHSGTDIGVAEGSKVYSTANGTVSRIVNKSSCGGNIIYIQHVIDGKKYTTAYMHLLKMYVKVGDKVTNETVIALSGGTTTSTKRGGYDSCTTGGHLHFSIGTGWYGVDYLTSSSWNSHLVDPAKTVPLPSSWSSR